MAQEGAAEFVHCSSKSNRQTCVALSVTLLTIFLFFLSSNLCLSLFLISFCSHLPLIISNIQLTHDP